MTKLTYDIYMNHTGSKGYRFFQSFLIPMKKELLSVNHDCGGLYSYRLHSSMQVWWGYFLLDEHDLRICPNQLIKSKQKKQHLHSLHYWLKWSFAQDHLFNGRSKVKFDSLVADAFPTTGRKVGALVIQDLGGRMKPANTFSSNFTKSE